MSVTIELNLILSDSETSKIFIYNHTLLFNPNRIELYKSNHSLSHNNFNRKISKEKNYTFCSIPVLDIYAYKMLNSKYAIYLLFDSSNNSLEKISAFLGDPDNISKEDFTNRDFDFLAWEKNNIEFILMKDRMSNYAKNTETKLIFIVTTIAFNDLMNKEKVF